MRKFIILIAVTSVGFGSAPSFASGGEFLQASVTAARGINRSRSFDVNGLWSAAPAGLSVECRDTREAFLSATLLKSSQYGIIALLGDGYDTTQLSQPEANGTVWMICQAEGADLVCPGLWQFGHVPTEARFSENASGDTLVNFTRDGLHGKKLVTLQCSSVRLP